MINRNSSSRNKVILMPGILRGRQAGFTLIELLTVFAIISALMAILLPAIQSARERSRVMQCRSNLRNLGQACETFHETFQCFPRNTIRPRGTTPIGGEPSGSLWDWDSGSYETWHREIMPFIEQTNARVQDAVPLLSCPADPRGPDYTVPEYGFTWYVGVYSNPTAFNNGIIIDDSDLNSKQTIAAHLVTDGMSNTIMIAERPPSADGNFGWWDSRCCTEDNISPVKGTDKPFSSGTKGHCPKTAYYRPGDYRDKCAFNVIWSCHHEGGNFCMADGSVRMLSYHVSKVPVGNSTLLESLASRSGAEVFSIDN